ncbi:unnamed protein product [Phaeothamnion confervicola]
MHLCQGRRYKTKITLYVYQIPANNSQVAAKFRELGFVDVQVSGWGQIRDAQGTWPQADRDVKFDDDRIGEIKEIM